MGTPTARLGDWLQVRTKPTYDNLFLEGPEAFGSDCRALLVPASSVRDCPTF
jgi:hypothetical protein